MQRWTDPAGAWPIWAAGLEKATRFRFEDLNTPGVAQHALADQVVDEQHSGLADRAHGLQGEQFRIAGANAYAIKDSGFHGLMALH